MSQLENHSLRAIRAYIEEGFDPSGVLCSTDDPQEIRDELNKIQQRFDGTETPLTLYDIAEYLEYLGTIGR